MKPTHESVQRCNDYQQRIATLEALPTINPFPEKYSDNPMVRNAPMLKQVKGASTRVWLFPSQQASLGVSRILEETVSEDQIYNVWIAPRR